MTHLVQAFGGPVWPIHRWTRKVCVTLNVSDITTTDKNERVDWTTVSTISVKSLIRLLKVMNKHVFFFFFLVCVCVFSFYKITIKRHRY